MRIVAVIALTILCSAVNSQTPHKVFYPDGKLRGEGQIDSTGKLNGLWIFYFEGGMKQSEGLYAHGQATGAWFFWSEMGRLESHGYYKADKMDSLWRLFAPNGQITQIESYKAGIKHGIYVKYQKDRANIITILSDTQQILNDLYVYFTYSNDYSFDVIGTPNFQPLNNDLLDYAAGYVMNITLTVNDWTNCAVPLQ